VACTILRLRVAGEIANAFEKKATFVPSSSEFTEADVLSGPSNTVVTGSAEDCFKHSLSLALVILTYKRGIFWE
jgi:hypothetical protein